METGSDQQTHGTAADVDTTNQNNGGKAGGSAQTSGDQQQGTNVFKGQPDSRQSSDVQHPVSRFRPTYRALTDDEKALHDEIKTKAADLEASYAKVKSGRYNSLAITALEQSVMWVVKELTS